jgi:2-methylcitrate dehydratase PrpD
MKATTPSNHPSHDLAEFAATLRSADIPDPVLERAEDLFLDLIASALAGKGAPPVEQVSALINEMGPSSGPSEGLIDRSCTSPLFAAMLNAASAHYAEQDDVHNGAVFHPGTVVIPPALALAQAHALSGRELLTAIVAGYEVGIRVGEYLGRSHYRIFHTTATAGVLAAAVAAGRLLGLDPAQMLHAIGSAGTQAGGLWEFLRDGADSKQLHTAHAAGSGLTAAWLAARGFRGARHVLEGPQGMAAGMHGEGDPLRLTDRLGERWALAETSFKYHASCRHTHPAADALETLMREHGLQADDLSAVTAHVHQAALDVLGPVVTPSSVHQAKFSMGTTLGLVAIHGYAGINEFARHSADPEVQAFRQRVEMVLDPAVEQAYPQAWHGKITVQTRAGATLQRVVREPKGDPGNTLSRVELEHKAHRLAAFSGAASPTEVDRLITLSWNLRDTDRICTLLPAARP